MPKYNPADLVANILASCVIGVQEVLTQIPKLAEEGAMNTLLVCISLD